MKQRLHEDLLNVGCRNVSCELLLADSIVTEHTTVVRLPLLLLHGVLKVQSLTNNQAPLVHDAGGHVLQMVSRM